MATVELDVDLAAPRESEDDRVVAWRREALGRAGFDELVALELALQQHVDLHRAVALLRNGCLLETARRILL